MPMALCVGAGPANAESDALLDLSSSSSSSAIEQIAVRRRIEKEAVVAAAHHRLHSPSTTRRQRAQSFSPSRISSVTFIKARPPTPSRSQIPSVKSSPFIRRDEELRRQRDDDLARREEELRRRAAAMEHEMQLRLNHQAMTAATTIANDLNSARSMMREEVVKEREIINAEKKNVMSAQQQIEYEYNLKVKEIEEKQQILIRHQKEQEERLRNAQETLKKQQLEMERSKDQMQREYLATVERMERDADNKRAAAVHTLPVSSPSPSANAQTFDIHTPRNGASSSTGPNLTSPDPFMTPPSSHHAHARTSFDLPSPLKPPPPPDQLPSAAAIALRIELAAKLEEERCRRRLYSAWLGRYFK